MQFNYIVTHAFLLFCLEAINLRVVSFSLPYVEVQKNCLNRLSEKDTFSALTLPVEIKTFSI